MFRFRAAAFFVFASLGQGAPWTRPTHTSLLAERKQPADSANDYPRSGFNDVSIVDYTENAPSLRSEYLMPDRGDRGRTERMETHRAALHEALGTSAEREEASGRNGGEEYLGHREVSGIMTIECLERRQRDANDPCTPTTPLPAAAAAVVEQQPGPLNMGSYPSWRDPACHSNGALFCDPEGLLQGNATVAKHLTDLVTWFKNNNRVTCGEVEAAVTGNPTLKHSRGFNLGVAIADDWPESEMDQTSLQKFGDLLMTQWGMLPFYNGVDSMNGLNPPISPSQADTNCPNAALLIIFPTHHEAYLASPNCQFICNERGGDMINTAVLDALETEGLAAAIERGMHEVGEILKLMTPQAMETFGARTYFRRRPSIREEWAKSEYAWIVAMRLLFFFIVSLFLYVLSWGVVAWLGEPLRTQLERSAAAAAEKQGKPHA